MCLKFPFAAHNTTELFFLPCAPKQCCKLWSSLLPGTKINYLINRVNTHGCSVTISLMDLCLGHHRPPCQDTGTINILILWLDESLQRNPFTRGSSRRALPTLVLGLRMDSLTSPSHEANWQHSSKCKYQFQQPKYCLPTALQPNVSERNVGVHQCTATSPHLGRSGTRAAASRCFGWQRAERIKGVCFPPLN